MWESRSVQRNLAKLQLYVPIDTMLLQESRHQVGLCSLHDQELIQCERCNSQNITISCGLQIFLRRLQRLLCRRDKPTSCEHLTADKNSHIFQNINRSETCTALCSEDCFSLLDTASTSFQLEIKEALHIGWEKPLLNKQVNHVNLSLSF